jgi:tetratricopeptide (TPR) repeat protein
MFSRKATIAAALPMIMSTVALTAPANALDLHTGEEQGAYHSEFCPALKTVLGEENLELDCKSSDGSLENLTKVTSRPTDFALAQYDLYAHAYTKEANQMAFKNVRDDIAKECVFMVSKNKLMSSFGDVLASAEYLNFILPPKNSGHAGTFNYIKSLSTDGLAKATKVTYAASTEDAITEALSSEDGIALFVQFPNPDNKHFKLVNENGGHFVPVLSREILADEVDGRKVYTAEETEVKTAGWTEKETKLVTACTPIVLFTGNPNRVTDETLKSIHQSAIDTFEKAPAEKLRPQEGWFSKILTNTKSLSATGVESLLVASEKASKAASPYVRNAKDAVEPYVEKAKEVTEPYVEKTKEVTKPYVDAAKEQTEKAVEAAKPTYEKAKEVTKDAYEATKEKTKEAMEAAKPTYEKAKEKTKEAYEATKEKTKEAIEAAKPKVEKAGEVTKSYYEKAKDYVSGWFSGEEDETTIEKNTEADKLPETQEQPAY